MIKTSMINASEVSIEMELRHLRYFIGVVDASYWNTELTDED